MKNNLASNEDPVSVTAINEDKSLQQKNEQRQSHLRSRLEI
jgi:hypothetical protein